MSQDENFTPNHIKEVRDKLLRTFEQRGRTPRQCYDDGWEDALSHLQPEHRRLKKLLKDLQSIIIERETNVPSVDV